MYLKNTAAKLEVFAFDYTTGAPKTGDASNLTAYVNIDDAGYNALNDTSATEVDSTNKKGLYVFDLAQSETNGTKLAFFAKSSTSSISVITRPPVDWTQPTTGLIGPTTAGRTLTADTSGNVTLADAVAHGGTLGSSTATLALSRLNVTSQTSNTVGVTVTGNGTGSGAVFTSGSGATGNGFEATSNATNGNGMSLTGKGANSGLAINAGLTGIGMYVQGGGTSGAAIKAQTTVGAALFLLAASGNGLTISGPADLSSTLNVAGATTLAGLSTGALACTTLTASSAVAFQSTFATTGTTTFNAFTITNLLSINGVSNVAQTGDSFARIGATGSGLTSLAQSSSWTSTLATNLTTLASHDPGATIGTGTSTLTQTQVTGGAYSVQSASCVLGDARIANLDAAVSTRLASASYTTPPTVAAIATAVWTDTTGSDFTTATSPGKIIFTQLGGSFTTTSSSVFSTAALANAPTGGSAPTATQIATAVWQDATAGDFTTVGSIGKSLGGAFTVLGTSVYSVAALANAPGGGGSVTVGGYDAGQDPATLVLDVLATLHNTAGSIGQKINSAGGAGDPLTNPLGDYASGTAGGALQDIGTSQVTTVSPVAQAGQLTLYGGDDYLAADNRAIDWTNAGPAWPSLAGATVLAVTDEGVSYTMSVITATSPGQQVRWEPTATVTSALKAAGPKSIRVVATLADGHVMTLFAVRLVIY